MPIGTFELHDNNADNDSVRQTETDVPKNDQGSQVKSEDYVQILKIQCKGS